MIPLAGVVYLGWSIHQIFYIYWIESFIVGFFTILKVHKIKAFKEEQKVVSWTNLAGLESSNSSGEGFSSMIISSFLVMTGIYGYIFVAYFKIKTPTGWVWMSVISLLLSHGISYVINFLIKKEYEKLRVEQLLFFFMKRGLVIQVSVFIGFIIMVLKDETALPFGFLVGMVIVKIAADALCHNQEHAS